MRRITGIYENKKEEKSVWKFPFVTSVRLTGLEPAHRKTLDPKSSASTNFATGAVCFELKLKE